jgi:hypothetical protein
MVMMAIMSASSTLIVFFRELRSASMETESPTGVADYIRNNPDSALAQMVDEKFQQEKLRDLSSRLLTSFARKKDLECDAGRLFAREMLAMQVFDLTAATCSTASYINWYIVETLKEVEDQGSLLGNDSRAKEAEEAMARAVAEAAEMTRLLAAERDEGTLQYDSGDPPITPRDSKGPDPQTTFRSTLRDPDILPPVLNRDATLQQPSSLPLTLDRLEAADADNRSSQEPPSSINTVLSAHISSYQPPSTSPDDEASPESLHAAKITLMDLSTDASAGKAIRQKSTLSFMITIEPPGGRVPGWVAIKTYVDFESLHDVLKRIANVGGIRSFPAELPEWKGKMHQSVSDELENYLRTALSVRQLADSEAMKRFFGKEITDQSLGKKKVWPPLKGVGEGMRDRMLSSAEGSQKLLAAAWATAGMNKKRSRTPVGKDKPRGEVPVSEAVKDEMPIWEEDTPYHSPLFRDSATFSRSTTTSNPLPDPAFGRNSTSSSLNGYMVAGDGETSKSTSTTSVDTPDRVQDQTPLENPEKERTGPLTSSAPDHISENPPSNPGTKPPSPAPPPLPQRPPKASTLKQPMPELSQNDAQQILDVGFSILSELYALSPRTWMIRKSLLNLLKSLLISNGRTYIETIRTMIQEDLINKCLASDEWIASQVKMITDSLWPAAPYPPIDDKAYKIQAKDLFMTKLLPETMRGLMGGAATSQALEIVFEALQDQRVAKGILVALMCDVIRAVQL